MIITCTCKHQDQDHIHGEAQRVANPATKNGKTSEGKQTVTCTVCGKQHQK